jgi:hypothetical protein
VAAKRSLTLNVPAATRDEIEALAAQAGRSVAFVVRRALAAGAAGAAVPDGARVPLTVAVDDEDPADTLARIRAAGGDALDDRLAAAWAASRARFLAWAAKLQAADSAARADDLDAGLRDAAAAATAPERLVELAASEYPRVRALVAAHAATPGAVRERLRRDRDRTVREAASASASAGAARGAPRR